MKTEKSDMKMFKAEGSKGNPDRARRVTMKAKVQQAIDKIRPLLQRDGGDVELVDVQDGIVTVRLRGACAGCPMSQMTLKNGIEKFLKQEVPEVISVQTAQ
jgi:Fe-S cluster biogenesis protein NfuA